MLRISLCVHNALHFSCRKQASLCHNCDFAFYCSCRSGEIGRRSRFKICRWRHRAGSIPASGTSGLQWAAVFLLFPCAIARSTLHLAAHAPNDCACGMAHTLQLVHRMQARPDLILSLQFGRFADVAQHRAALPRHRVQRWLRHALLEDVQTAEITVRIVGSDEAQSLNRNYRQRDYATNVLTFDYSAAPHVCADLLLCADVVAKEATEQGKTLQAHYAHLLVHGALHAQGWDHETSDADADAMEAQEMRILAGLGFANPYA